jgi:5-methylcytosine-specific restriction protein A
MDGGRAVAYSLPKGPAGRALCRWCEQEVGKGRRTFCSDTCVHAWRLRSNPGYLRTAVLQRDRGICARCTVDTVDAYALLKRSRGSRRAELLTIWGLTALTRKSLWDADHILPVVEGGGECDLDNLRTLCVHCHRVATGELRKRLQAKRIGTA